MRALARLAGRWRARQAPLRHARAIAGILETAPIVPRADGLVLFSMIGTAVVLPYLVAIKSLWRQVGRGRIAILDDGTLTGADRQVLAHHCGDPQIIALAEVEQGALPKGGCWERLLTILDRRAGEYWIQIDSDTVTLGPVPEIIAAISANRSFTLLGGEDAGDATQALDEFCRRHYPGGPREGHIQARIESRLARIAQPGWRYIRGCAGFAGFAAGGPGREAGHEVAGAIADLVGKDGAAIWGTEQVASNLLIASEPGSVMLPYGRYLNYWARDWGDQAAFVHFVGTHRHDHGAYIRASQQAIAGLPR